MLIYCVDVIEACQNTTMSTIYLILFTNVASETILNYYKKLIGILNYR